jgi:hypothetical protein
MDALARERAVTGSAQRRWLQIAVASIVLAAASVYFVQRDVQPASAGPTLVQTGSVITAATHTITLTLPGASTTGTLLIAMFSGWGDNSSTNGPAGWTNAIETSGGLSRRTSIWYYANNPGGISSAQFTLGSSTTWVGGQMTEWSSMDTLAPLDVSNRGNSASGTTFNIAGGQNTAVANELAVTVWQEDLTSASTVTFTPGSGYTNFGNTGATSNTTQYTADYDEPIANNTNPSETQTSNVSATTGWLAAIATFAPTPTCTGGSLTINPQSQNFSVTLNGTNRTNSQQLSATASDMTGSGSGWNIQLTSTQFTTGSHTLSTSATSVTGASNQAQAGTCIRPTKSVGYPTTVPAGAGPPTAVKIYHAAASTGEGAVSVTFNMTVAVPANAFAGTYNSTWTYTIATGP